MAWFHLLVAAAFEVAFAMGMKFSNGFRQALAPSLLDAGRGARRDLFLTLALRELPVSVAYADLDRDRLAGTVFLGVLLLGESLTAVKRSRRVDASPEWPGSSKGCGV
ncbi:protein SugE [Pseudomonas aeruginosa]|nr:protein SugE [Pseudomonas aeruginosa]